MVIPFQSIYSSTLPYELYILVVVVVVVVVVFRRTTTRCLLSYSKKSLPLVRQMQMPRNDWIPLY